MIASPSLAESTLRRSPATASTHSDHPARGTIGSHDATARLEGPAVTDVAEHFRMRWHEINGEQLAPVAPTGTAGDVELQIVRTVPDGGL